MIDQMAIDDFPTAEQFQQLPNSGVSGYGTGGTAPPPITTAPTTTAPAPATTTAPTAGGQVTMQQFNQAWLSSPYPGTVDGLKQFMAAHPEYAAAGITLGGSKGDKVYGPGGSYWGDAVIGAGAGGLGKSGLSGDTGGGQGGTLASLGYGFGSSMAPWNEQFAAPTADQALNTPGVQFGLEEANRMAQNGAAAKGTLLNGRFQQALSASNIGNALQAYGSIYDRGLGEYLLKRENFYNNEDRPFSKNLSLASLGKPGA